MSSRKRRPAGAYAGVALSLGLVYVVVAGTVTAPEIVAGIATGLAGAAVAAVLTLRARVIFRPPLRWTLAVARALPPLAVESVLLGAALVCQLAGRGDVRGSEDRGQLRSHGADAMTAAIAAATYPGLTPNTVVRTVGRGQWVSGRRLLDRRGHALQDDLARLS